MAASLRFYAADGTTIITSLYLGSVGSPGSTDSQKVIIENFGDRTAGNLSVAVQAVPNVDGSQWGLVAPDSNGTPGAFVAGPLSIAPLQPGRRVTIWTRSTVSAGQAAQSTARRYQVVASGAETDQGLTMKAKISAS